MKDRHLTDVGTALVGSMKRISILGLSIVAILLMSGMAASSASATCLRVKAGEKSTFEKRSATGKCEGSLTPSGYVETEGAGEPVAGEAGVQCYKVKAGEPSGWEDNKCTKAKAGTGEYAKIKECRVLYMFLKAEPATSCNEPPGVSITEATKIGQSLRANADKFIIGTEEFEGFGTDALAVNTAGALRFSTKISGVAFRNKNPAGYAFFGLKLETNPPSANCSEATGQVRFADIQDATPSAVFDGNGAWKIRVKSDLCSSEPGKVKVENTSLLFEQLGAGKTPVISTGEFVGTYSQPSSVAGKCPAGGVELAIDQPGITTTPASTGVEIDNGTTGKNAYICFVSANNYLFPETEPKWAPFNALNGPAEEVYKGVGIWKD